MKKTLIFLILMLCLIPCIATAAEYDASKIYFGEIATDSILLKPGDKIKGGSRITVELYYADAEGNVVERGNSSVKSVVIDGEKVTEWRITETSGAVMQVGNMIAQGAFGYTLKPAYAVADNEGYYELSEKTYHLYKGSEAGKKVKLIGTIIDADDALYYLEAGENAIIAVKTENDFSLGDRIDCKGEISGNVDYQGNQILEVDSVEAVLRQYEPLHRGDAGEAVLEMKIRMQTLGYFRASAELSDSYNDTCFDRVKLFQQKNGLPATGDADIETLTVLFSDAAKPND